MKDRRNFDRLAALSSTWDNERVIDSYAFRGLHLHKRPVSAGRPYMPALRAQWIVNELRRQRGLRNEPPKSPAPDSRAQRGEEDPMFGRLDLTWKPKGPTDVTPPAGKAPAIVRGDTYAHVIRVTDGWLLGLQDNDYAAQLRADRLTSSTAGDPLASFTVDLEQDGDALLITIGLTSTVTLGLLEDMFWDLQSISAGDVVTTLLSGAAKTLDDVTRVA